MNPLSCLKHYMLGTGIQCLLVPINDKFFQEEVLESNKRLRHLTGFNGSSATLIVLAHGKAHFFTDGRYMEQARLSLDPEEYVIHNYAEMMPHNWINEEWRRLFWYDPSLHTNHQLQQYNVEKKALVENLVDVIWVDRPLPSWNGAYYYSEASLDSLEKCKKVIEVVGDGPYLITDPESLCWLLNLRGRDLVYNPIFLAFGILYSDLHCDIFYEGDLQTIPSVVNMHCIAMEKLPSMLSGLDHVFLDEAKTSCELMSYIISYNDVPDPCMQLRAIKTPEEIAGIKMAHLRDGVAVTNFLYWAYHNVFTEASAEQKLLELRSEQSKFWGPSFRTIAAYGANASLIHYSGNNDLAIKPGNMFLIDSGGHYLDGTTDVTRTIPVGECTEEMRRHYTLVLKGLVALSKVIFPERGVPAKKLDVLARQFLWLDKLDYAHGTGHGVGLFLSVHEGPYSFNVEANLCCGVVISNEPGCYVNGSHGIRVENLMYVKGAGDGFLQFETLTCVPINTDLVELSMLTDDEVDWLDSYNLWVLQQLEPYLSREVSAWVGRWFFNRKMN